MGAYKAAARRTSLPAQHIVTAQVAGLYASPRSEEALLLQNLPADALEASSVHPLFTTIGITPPL